MLRNLHIRNLALIKEVDVDFAGGLNILTGETGAGKSIVIDAIGLALGGRAARDPVRGDGSYALVELVFEVSGPGNIAALRGLGIEPEDGVILISRKIQDGRSTIRINGETVTASTARECAGFLIDIHGQSEHQKLLLPERQLALIDEYGGKKIGALKERVSREFRTYNNLRRELESEDMTPEARAARISFLTYEVDEIDAAGLVPGEDEELETRFRRLSNARKIAEAVEEVHRSTGYDSDGSAGEVIGRAVRILDGVSVYDERLAGFSDQLSEIDSLLNDFNRDVAAYGSDLSFETDSFEEISERLNLINRLKTKYGRTISDILESGEERRNELRRLETYEEDRENLKRRFAEAEEKLAGSCAELTRERKNAAKSFVRGAVKQFSDLNFANADFAAEWRELPSYTAGGKDAVDFVISTNPGEPRKPLKNVVSGGELSRLMLGIRTLFADEDSVETVIFDEVDAGISGRTAQKAAEKLSVVSRTRQVICITHLPQIAAMADSHYGITKDVGADSAITNIEQLDERESVLEIARLIGGAEITSNTVGAAGEMKEMCRHFKAAELK